MLPGLYVVRRTRSHRSRYLIVESRRFDLVEGAAHPLLSVDSWRDFVASEHPKDDVFVIEVKS
jgi:hypothetical protein